MSGCYASCTLGAYEYGATRAFAKREAIRNCTRWTFDIESSIVYVSPSSVRKDDDTAVTMQSFVFLGGRAAN